MISKIVKYSGSEVIVSLFKSQKKKAVKILILGDSVANQCYNNKNYNGDVYSLTCNQAISMAGQYCLLKQFCENNRDELPKEIILFYNPFSLTNNLDEYAFHYFLKHFYYNESLHQDLNIEVVNHRVKQIPLKELASFATIKAMNYSPEYSLPNENKGYLASPISITYLHKMQKICKKYHIKFSFIPSPIKISRKKELEELTINENEHLIAKFISEISFLPDSLFVDHIHFKSDKIPQDLLELECK